MKVKTVDARSLPCPKPLILSKKAYDELGEGEECVVLIDNESSKDNVARFFTDNKISYTVQKNGTEFQLVMTKGTVLSSKVRAEDYCSVEKKNFQHHVICFSSDQMGRGAEELGKILIQGFTNTVKEISPLPAHIVFYNSGVLLATLGSPVIPSLKELESLGVEMSICGTCLDYYKMKDKIQVGKVSNMFAIMEVLSRASHVVTP